MEKVSVSVVVPVYAGSPFLRDLSARIESVRNRWANSQAPFALGEAIFVNDDSRDDSLEILYTLQKSRSWFKIVNLSRNFGQHSATVAGILHSSGDWIVTIDEDLQHEPEHIDKMLEAAVSDGSDVVYANPEESVHESLFRDWSSKTFKRIVALVAGNEHIRVFNSFRLIRGSVARAAGSVCTHGTYFDIALCWFTTRVRSVKLPLKDVRYVDTGSSGYNFRKLLSHARRMVISSEAKVVRVGAAIGFLAMLLVALLGSRVIYLKIVDSVAIPVQGWTSLFLMLLFFGGLLSVLLGIALEYISVILLHIQGKPTFFTIDRLSDKRLADFFSNGPTSDYPGK